MLLLDSKRTIWNFTVAVLSELQPNCLTSRHSMTSSRLGAAPVTAQNAFCAVPGTGYRSSQNGATRVPIAEVGMAALT